METRTFLSAGRDILDKIGEQDPVFLQKQAELLLDRYPEAALAHFVMARCLREQGDIPGTLRYLAAVIRLDPGFASAAELLLELNKDSYSIGELKDLYRLTAAHKPPAPEVREFLRKFRDVPFKTELSIPEADKKSETAAEKLPGPDDDTYIGLLIDQMDRPEAEDKADLQTDSKNVSTIEIVEDTLPLPGESISDKESDSPSPLKKSYPQAEAEQAAPAAGASAPQESYPLKTNTFQPPRKQAPPQNNSKQSPVSSSYGIETLTMAQLYVRQGLYDYALDILLKLQKRDPGSERIRQEIERVKQCMNQEIRE